MCINLYPQSKVICHGIWEAAYNCTVSRKIEPPPGKVKPQPGLVASDPSVLVLLLPLPGLKTSSLRCSTVARARAGEGGRSPASPGLGRESRPADGVAAGHPGRHSQGLSRPGCPRRGGRWRGCRPSGASQARSQGGRPRPGPGSQSESSDTCKILNFQKAIGKWERTIK